MKAITSHLLVFAWLKGSERGQFIFFWQIKCNTPQNLRFQGKFLLVQQLTARLYLLSLCIRGTQAFFPFPAPLQLHLSSLTEKVWNRLKVGPQNKKLWHVVKPVWNTHTQWAQKGKLKAVRVFYETFFLAYLIVCSCVHTCSRQEGKFFFFDTFSHLKQKTKLCV